MVKGVCAESASGRELMLATEAGASSSVGSCRACTQFMAAAAPQDVRVSCHANLTCITALLAAAGLQTDPNRPQLNPT
jgi:hypothetical protein